MERLMRLSRTTQGRLRRLFGEHGAIDMVATIVGVIVVGLVAAIGTTAVAVAVPWAQDSSSRADIANVQTAEATALVGTKTYLLMEDLITEKLVQPMRSLAVMLDPDASCYVVAAVSQSGAVFFATSRNDGVREYNSSAADVTWCVDNDLLFETVEALVNGTPPPTPELPPPPAPDWRELVTPGNGITVILDVGVRVMRPGEFCLDVKVGSTSETPAAWQVDIDTTKPPFYGRTTSLWTSHSIIHSSGWSHITGRHQSSSPWNNSWNPGNMAAGSEYTFSVCESSMLAPPDRPETYTMSVAPSGAAGQWGGRVACLVATITGTGAYPFFSGWAHSFDITPAIAELASRGYSPERLSWSPNGSVGQTVSPNRYQPGVTDYVVTNGRDNAIRGSEVSTFTLCVHDD